VLPISRLHGAQDVDGGDVGAGEGAIVDDLFDAGARRRDLSGEIGQPTRPIADNSVEAAEAAVGDQAAFDYATQNIWINIASAEEKDDALAGQFGQLTRQTGSQGCCGRALHHAFLQLDDA
jgi:hypothetical protein